MRTLLNNSLSDNNNIGTDDPLRDTRINATNEHNLSKSNSLSANATLQLNRKLNDKGRNITFRGSFGYGDDDSDQYAQSETRYYQIKNYLGGSSLKVPDSVAEVPFVLL